MESKLASLSILTWNEEKYIKDCLDSIYSQTYPYIEVLAIDNGSKDNTIKKLKDYQAKIDKKKDFPMKIIENGKDLGYTGGNNIAIKNAKGEYVIYLNTDLILHKDFVKNVIETMEKDEKIGSVQGKIYQLNNNKKTDKIDTIGFEVFKSGEIIDKAQGEKDSPSKSKQKEIFAVNGVAPAFRRKALDDVKIGNDYLDEDFFCYTEDIDLGWRLYSRGWKAVYNPEAMVWHDRTSAKKLGKGFAGFRAIRKKQSLWLRRISWRNQWFLFIKNLSFTNFIVFFPRFFLRQAKIFLYLAIFETRVFSCLIDIIRLFPKMVKKRRIIMKQRKVSNKDIRKWFK